MEDYLEAVLILEEKQIRVRCVDVAELLGVPKPSVTRAVRNCQKEATWSKGRPWPSL